jgi:hypothetical protein
MSARCASSFQGLAATLVVVVVGLSVCGRPASAQSLAEVAKKEEDRRETIRVPAKVYTNKDLRPAPSGAVVPAADKDKDKDKAKDSDTDADGKPKTAKAGDSKEPVKDRAYWSGKLKGLQQTLERDQGYFTALQSRINALTTDAVNRDDPIQRSKLEQDRQKAVAELGRLTKAISDDQKAIADLLEDARTSGVPPAWLR